MCYQLILSFTVGEVFENFEIPHCCSSIFFSVFAPNTWRVSRDKKIESLNHVFLHLSFTTRFAGITRTLTQPCVMWTLIRINPMSLSFNLHLMLCKMSQSPSAWCPSLKYYWWVVGSWVRIRVLQWVSIPMGTQYPPYPWVNGWVMGMGLDAWVGNG